MIDYLALPTAMETQTSGVKGEGRQATEGRGKEGEKKQEERKERHLLFISAPGAFLLTVWIDHGELRFFCGK